MSYQAGDTYPATLTVRNADGAPEDPETLTLKVRDHEGEVTTYEYGTDEIIVRDEEGEFHADIPLTDAGMWAWEWATTNEAQVEGGQISVSAAPTLGVTFATVDEVQTLMGTLTDPQRTQAQMLLEIVTGTIIEGVDRDDAWAATYSPIPRVVRGVCLDVVVGAMRISQTQAAAGGASSESETLGAYSHTVRYGEYSGSSSPASGGGSLSPTDAQMRMCRRAIIGTLSGSAQVPSLITELATGTRERPVSDDTELYDWTS